jgi:hypothetical protein
MPGIDRPPALRVVMESARIAALHSYSLAESPAGEPFNTLVRMAAHLAQAPIAMISLIGRDHQSIKAAFGTDIQQMPRSLAFCNHAIADPSGAMVVPDTLADSRFQNHPHVLAPPHIRFYAGVCLVDDDGYALGTLCVMDHKPSRIEEPTLAVMHTMAKEAMNALALQRAEQNAGWGQAVPAPDWPNKPSPHSIAPPPSSTPASSTPASQVWLGVRTEHKTVPGTVQEGRVLKSVAAHSPAERAKLLVGDIILSIDGRLIKRRHDITAAVSGRALGEVMRLQVWRNGSLFECGLCLEAIPEARVLQRNLW